VPLPKFDYQAPTSLKEAQTLLRDNPGAMVMAGGTDVLLQLDQLRPKLLVSLRRVPGLDTLAFDEQRGLRIGALVRLNQVSALSAVRTHYVALAEAIDAMATVQVRNRGTVVGNVCRASPCADTAAPLVAFGAAAVVASGDGEKTISLDEFFFGPGQTALKRGELLREVVVPCPKPSTGVSYHRISARSEVDIAAATVAVSLELDDGGVCVAARVVLGGVAPIPWRVKDAEQLLVGQSPREELFEEAGKLAMEQAQPICDVRASIEWRREVVRVMTVRALKQSFARAGGEA
jgi:CO/xanthine dehydrogenase FAD-binding subunit